MTGSVIPPRTLNAPINGIFDKINQENVNHNVAIKPPAKIFPHKRKDIDTSGAIWEITSSGLMKIGIFFPFFVLTQKQNFFK